jgi:hypothetical protein
VAAAIGPSAKSFYSHDLPVSQTLQRAGLSIALASNVVLKAALALALIFGVAPQVRANAILDGGFESGDFADWVVSPPGSGSLLFEGGGGHTGSFAAWFGAVGSIADTMSQTFTTVPGESYLFSFWIDHAVPDSSNVFTALWDGLPIVSLVNAGQFGYTEYTLVETATGTSTTIDFSGRDRLSFFRLDDISVTPAESPEPATAVLFGTGVIGLSLWMRYRFPRTRARPFSTN